MISAGSKDRIVRSFKERVFQPGAKILRESDPPALCNAYIIKEGHVNLVSRLSPYDVQFDKETGEVMGIKTRPEDYAIPALGLQDKRRSGYMSRTTNSFVFASKGKYCWVGEDILLLQPMDPLYYSVIAQGRVVALEISKVELASKLPN
jgi:hypothetical protein